MNNMNNFGMNNQLGINPMLMNNMGMNNMGMNNIQQQNLMDETAMRVKNITLPYEIKIKQLEEIIRQKDFEIALLKEKLNNKEINIQNQIFQNVNQMNMNMNMMNQKSHVNKGKEICVNFENSEKYLCFEDDLAYKLFDKINPNYNFNLFKFSINGKKIHPFLTLEENGIKDGSLINCGDAKNIIFRGFHGFLNIALDIDFPIKKAIEYYLLRIGKEGCYNKFIFSFSDKILNIEDKTPIKELFNEQNVNIYVIKKYN